MFCQEGKISSLTNNPEPTQPVSAPVDDTNINDKKISSLTNTALNAIDTVVKPIRTASNRIIRQITPRSPRRRNICHIVTYALTGGLVIAGSLAIASKVSSLNISSYLAPLAAPFAYLADKVFSVFSSSPSNATFPLTNASLPRINPSNISNFSFPLSNAIPDNASLVNALNVSNASFFSFPLINAMPDNTSFVDALPDNTSFVDALTELKALDDIRARVIEHVNENEKATRLHELNVSNASNISNFSFPLSNATTDNASPSLVDALNVSNASLPLINITNTSTSTGPNKVPSSHHKHQKHLTKNIPLGNFFTSSLPSTFSPTQGLNNSVPCQGQNKYKNE